MGPGEESLGDTCFVIQFCDRNADDLSSFLDGDDSAGPRGAQDLMSTIRLSRPRKATAPAAPPARVWSAIEDTLRREGLVK
jgi:hypothetical protein